MIRYEFTDEPGGVPGTYIVRVMDRAGRCVFQQPGLTVEQVIAFKAGWRAAERVLEARGYGREEVARQEAAAREGVE